MSGRPREKKAPASRESVEKQRGLAEKMEALALMAGGVAHDFNNILGAMMGFAEMAKERSPEESRQEHHLRRVLEAGKKAAALSRNCSLSAERGAPGWRPCDWTAWSKKR